MCPGVGGASRGVCVSGGCPGGVWEECVCVAK